MNHKRLTVAGIEKRRAQGRVVGAIPHGYTRDGDHLIPNDAEKRVVALARELRAQGLTLRAIGDELAARGHLNRAGRPYQAASVLALLRAAA